MSDPSNDLLESIAASPHLPSLPAIALEVVGLVQRPDVNIDQLASTIGNDPALSSKILKTVNSSFYAQARSITTISQAIVVLGMNTVRTLALGFTLVDSVGKDDGSLDHEEFWQRNIRAATGARTLATHFAPAQREEAFLAGLLCRLGVLALDRVLGIDYAALFQTAEGDFIKLETLEVEEYGFTHLAVGEQLAANWNLPAMVSESMAHHRAPDEADDSMRDLVRLVAAGDDLAGVFSDAPGAALERYRSRTAEWYEINEAAADALVTEADTSTKELFQTFEINSQGLPGVAEILTRANEALATISMQAAQDAVRLEEQNRALEAQATTDGLTGLANRRHFDQFVTEQTAIAHRYRGPLTVLFMDLDHFKQVNDTHGHQAGDDVLRSVGAVLRATMREADLPARYGGEEFAVVMPATTLEEGAQAAERVRVALNSSPVEITGGDPIIVTASIGVAQLLSTKLEAPEGLVARADAAVYEAKNSGRNRVVVAAEETAAA